MAIWYAFGRLTFSPDPNQLPPTVLSTEATKWGYDQSLFVRMQKQQPGAVHLLRCAITTAIFGKCQN